MGITPGVLAVVRMRRARGDLWKQIESDLQAAGLPRGARVAMWRAENRDRARELGREHSARHRARKA